MNIFFSRIDSFFAGYTHKPFCLLALSFPKTSFSSFAGHDRRYAVDWRKIKRELGWRPLYKFETYLQKTIEWYKESEWWWKPLKA